MNNHAIFPQVNLSIRAEIYAILLMHTSALITPTQNRNMGTQRAIVIIYTSAGQYRTVSVYLLFAYGELLVVFR